MSQREIRIQDRAAELRRSNCLDQEQQNLQTAEQTALSLASPGVWIAQTHPYRIPKKA
jgi:hypothetical protein